ncbi:hypothetical protein BDV95DRAFT_501453 [Massariosphaeria phaeospora]|uniref:Uncharacterized protein n=1 Tax=Massariosphaeria phaeospora TaxID=100035 RepID=A0A7C8M4Z5_9PLEO|nr:hypothetical protein BDV95DRAFT_501453 [Massariosphaeria phaeospora]
MLFDRSLTDSKHSTPACYFSIPFSSAHLLVETPTTTAVSEYTPNVSADPSHPLLAFRQPTLNHNHSPIMDASKLLQLQTAAAHSRSRNDSSSSSCSDSDASSGNSSSSQAMLCCCRCRRESTRPSAMVRFGHNLYYCNHCASMVGYSAD